VLVGLRFLAVQVAGKPAQPVARGQLRLESLVGEPVRKRSASLTDGRIPGGSACSMGPARGLRAGTGHSPNAGIPGTAGFRGAVPEAASIFVADTRSCR
jgi:hypothetical protein